MAPNAWRRVLEARGDELHKRTNRLRRKARPRCFGRTRNEATCEQLLANQLDLPLVFLDTYQRRTRRQCIVDRAAARAADDQAARRHDHLLRGTTDKFEPPDP